jgi:uncharacterized membrane-anchored protein
MKMLALGLCLALAGPAVAAAAAAPAQSKGEARGKAAQQQEQQPSADQLRLMQEIESLAWERGPRQVELGRIARLSLPEGTRFLGSAGTRRFVELNENPPVDNAYTVAAEDLSWFAIFQYEDSGHIDDSERLDPAALLATMREGEEASNAERRALNMPESFLEGWLVEPRYDRGRHNLEWGTRFRDSDSGIYANYTTRILGRDGVMVTVLVTNPENMTQDLASFRQVLAGFSYAPGRSYAEFRPGDRVAEYGLAALVTGGAAAALAKSGGGKALAAGAVGLLKLGAAGAAAIGAGLFGWMRRRRREDEEV